ncbi:hypothetical protein D3C85_1834360 [compost metagenome]
MQVAAIEGFSEGAGDVWTSTPYGSIIAWAVNFEDGGVDCWGRFNEFRVRPVRSIIA